MGKGELKVCPCLKTILVIMALNGCSQEDVHSPYNDISMVFTLKLSLVILMANFCEPLIPSITLQPPRGITP